MLAKADLQWLLRAQVILARLEGRALSDAFAVEINLQAVLGFNRGEVMPTRGQRVVVGRALSGFYR